MFTKPTHGWTKINVKAKNKFNRKVTIGWRVSYLTNVPLELLTALLNWYTQHMPQIVELDLEDKGVATMIISGAGDIEFFNTSYISPTIYRAAHIDDFADEILEEIESNIDEWSSFYCSLTSKEDIKNNKKVINELIAKIKEKRKDEY